ncbi:hypothetical protein RchiOBHm_Chr4g0415731 [Rosa chinensis]|uniref:Uncharacterized protein n=1 Tax=Rosa chinensis TaxID=74649 RepID=A0A2P6QWN4_ROSCH|nr:hypothetical protein RchiOBHm_Chr4g0415731 [Rosa chinensis]
MFLMVAVLLAFSAFPANFFALSLLSSLQIGVDPKDLEKVFIQLTLEFLSEQVNE